MLEFKQNQDYNLNTKYCNSFSYELVYFMQFNSNQIERQEKLMDRNESYLCRTKL
jgi:hypothetical protein